MSEKFSATLRIGDLNDYIAPSQGCVVSLKANTNPASTSASISRPPRFSAEELKKFGTAVKPVETEPVKISLKDCLACSGCITSAETVLLEKQGLDEFLSNLNNGKAVIISVSPQSRASLAVHYGLSPVKAFKKLTTLFKSLGVKAVFDTSCSRDLTLIESCYEFMTRYKHNQSAIDDESKLPLPMISSACPGWICYAEKSLGSYVLPYISPVKSPQQAIGSIIKKHICQKLGLRTEDIYHVTVMPCYDKKLEAVRDDFVSEVEPHGPMIPEVDSVLTTGELLDLIKAKSIDFERLDDSPLDRLLTNVDEGNDQLYGVHGSSGGYAETVFRYAAKELFGKEIAGSLDFKTIRNSDFKELTLEIEGKAVLKFALCYGFRNLQNVVRKIKIGKSEYQFLEIMACPSGCLNGGGQIKPKQGESAKDLIQSLESKYTENVLEADPFENPIIKELYSEWLDAPGSEKSKREMHTAYHPMVKSVTSELHNW